MVIFIFSNVLKLRLLQTLYMRIICPQYFNNFIMYNVFDLQFILVIGVIKSV